MKKLHVLLAILVLAAALIVPTGAVYAESPQIGVSGEIRMEWNGYFELKQLIGERGIMFSSMGFNDVCTGSLAGKATEKCDSINDTNYGTYNGTFTSKGTLVFEGSLDGKPGTFTANFLRIGKGGMEGYAKGQQTIVSGTGALADWKGTMFYTVYPQSDGSCAGTYTILFQIPPYTMEWFFSQNTWLN